MVKNPMLTLCRRMSSMASAMRSARCRILLTWVSLVGRGDLTVSERRRLFSQATLSIRHTRGVQDGVQKMPFVDIPPRCFDTKYIIDADLRSETGVTTRVYDMCSRGCQAFTGRYKKWDDHRICLVCKHPRPKNVRKRCPAIKVYLTDSLPFSLSE